jgi:hypothetical protein
MSYRLNVRTMRHALHVTQSDALRRSVTLHPSAFVVIRNGATHRGEGGPSPSRSRTDGPHRAFVIKISKLNTKSPRDGTGVKSFGDAKRGPRGSHTRNSAKFPRTFSAMPIARRCRNAQTHASVTSTRHGVGGLKSLAGRGHATASVLTRRFFFPPRRFESSKANQTKPNASQALGFARVHQGRAAQ